MLNTLSSLFSESDPSRRIGRLQTQIATLKRRQPERIKVRQVYVKTLLDMSDSLRKQGHKLRDDHNLSIVQRHSSGWNELPRQTKHQFEREAEVLRQQRTQDIQDSISHLQARVALEKRWSADESGGLGQPTLVSSCRLSRSAIKSFDDMFRSKAFSPSEVAAMREQALWHAAPPEKRFQEMFRQFDGLVSQRPPYPPWMPLVCRNRDRFADCIFRVSCGGTTYLLKLLYATQQPLNIVFCKAVEESVALPGGLGLLGVGLDVAAASAWDHTFLTEPLPIISMDDLLSLEEHTVEVLCGLVHIGGLAAASHNEWMPLQRFLDEHPDIEQQRARKAGAEKAVKYRRLVADQLKDHPWLVSIMDTEEGFVQLASLRLAHQLLG